MISPYFLPLLQTTERERGRIKQSGKRRAASPPPGLPRRFAPRNDVSILDFCDYMNEKAMTTTRRQALHEATKRLKQINASDPETDAQLLLAEAIGVPRLSLLTALHDTVNDTERATFERLLALRESGLPLQYALFEAPFMGRSFYVNQNVLIPRFDTERLCEAAILQARGGMSVLEIGTGSGAVAITVALAVSNIHMVAVDISDAALSVAKINAKRHQANVSFFESDVFSSLAGQRFDLILSNPPYIREAEMAMLPPEVQREPEIALNGGADGLSVIRRIIEGLPNHLKPGGSLTLEVGDGQAAQVAELIKKHFEQVLIQRDYNQLERVVTGDRYAG